MGQNPRYGRVLAHDDGKPQASSKTCPATAVSTYAARSAIAEGEIELKLPSERSFAEEYEVAYTTVRHAMAVLRDRGIIVTVHGRGTFATPREG